MRQRSGIAYIKEAKFVPAELKEKWPLSGRRLINSMARRGAARLVELSHPVVEAGVYSNRRDSSSMGLSSLTKSWTSLNWR